MKNILLLTLGCFIILITSCAGNSKPVDVQNNLTAQKNKESTKVEQVPQIDMAKELAKIDTMLYADSPNATIAHESYLRALDMVEDNKIIFAELFYKRALAYEPTSHFLLAELIKILLRQNKLNEAFPLLQLATQSPKATGEDFVALARIYKEKNELDSSLKYYEKAANKMNDNLGVLYEYAQVLKATKNFKELKRVNDILLVELDYPPAILEEQMIIYKITETPDSLLANLLGEAFKANSTQYPEYGYIQAEILISLKKYSEANEVLLTLFFMNKSKEFTSGIALKIANNYELMDNITVAIIWLEQIIAQDSTNHIALNNLGYMLIDRDLDVKRGINLVNKALSYSPNELSYLDSKAWGLYKIGQYEESLKIFEKLAESGMDVKELWLHLVKVCEALKLDDKVKQYKAKIKE